MNLSVNHRWQQTGIDGFNFPLRDICTLFDLQFNFNVGIDECILFYDSGDGNYLARVVMEAKVMMGVTD